MLDKAFNKIGETSLSVRYFTNIVFVYGCTYLENSIKARPTHNSHYHIIQSRKNYLIVLKPLKYHYVYEDETGIVAEMYNKAKFQKFLLRPAWDQTPLNFEPKQFAYYYNPMSNFSCIKILNFEAIRK